MSIEQTYNRLMVVAREAKQLTQGDLTGIPLNRVRAYRDRVAARATEIAAAAWPMARAALAEQGRELPAGPLEFGSAGFSCHELQPNGAGEGNICMNRPRVEGEPTGYVSDALASLELELEREAIAAADAFERYRRAVAQGVAVDPAESTTEQDEP